MILDAIRNEYQRYKSLAEKALEQVRDEDLHLPLEGDGNSLAVLFHHMGGNLRSRFTDFLTSDGEKPWRDRDGEFLEGEESRDDLLALWQAGWQTLFDTLDQLTDADLGRAVHIRRQPLTVLDALTRSLAHAAYHSGQIVLIARTLAGPSWQSLSIPRGASAAYNENPTREKAGR